MHIRFYPGYFELILVPAFLIDLNVSKDAGGEKINANDFTFPLISVSH
jgi:hypothetical protein